MTPALAVMAATVVMAGVTLGAALVYIIREDTRRG